MRVSLIFELETTEYIELIASERKFKLVQAKSGQVTSTLRFLVDRAIKYVIKIPDEFQTRVSLNSESLKPAIYISSAVSIHWFKIKIIAGPLQVHTVLFFSGLLG